MTKIYSSIEQLIGKTPILSLEKIKKQYSLKANLLAKLESFNPAGSVKDRVALEMINDAENKGLLKQGGTVIEATSGNTGIGLCLVAVARGYNAVIVMPDNMSVERIKLIKAYGGKVVLTPASSGMAGAIAKAEEIQKSTENSFIAGQFVNGANAQAHYKSTAPEIWEDLDGNIDIFVAGIGTGGTITGIGKFLKEKNPNIKIVGVEPLSSPVLTQGKKGAHAIQGIGAGFVPEILDLSVVDQIITVSDADAMAFGRLTGRVEGFTSGISAGAVIKAGVTIASQKENEGKNIVLLLADGGEKYLSTPLFED